MDIQQCYKYLHEGVQPQKMLSEDLVQRLVPLGIRLTPLLRRLGAREDGGVFTKLTGRSAKDAPLYTRRLDDELARRLDGGGADAALAHLFDAALSLARVTDAAHAIWLLVNSSRVFEDLDCALRHPERWDQAVVVRTWWPGVSSDLEFRLFVHAGRPTGLTQYNHLLFSARIASRGARIAGALRRYFEEVVQPRLEGTPFDAALGGRYACDLALHPDALAFLDAHRGDEPPRLGREQVQLVELNAFYEATGMGLFDYHADAHVLTHGPFEWRVLPQPLPRMEVRLEREWRQVLGTALKREQPGAAVRSERRYTDEAWAQLEAAMA